MKVFGIAMVRNEADVIRQSVLHHLSLGLDRILVVDNGSTDGTDRTLQELSRDSRVRWTRDTGGFNKPEVVTALAREAFGEGADWVVPFDADEFWHAPRGGFREALESSRAGGLRARVLQFVQRRAQRESSPQALRHMTHRVPEPRGAAGKGLEELVESRRVPYIGMLHPPKCVSRRSPRIRIDRGNHAVKGLRGPLVDTEDLVCLHAPLRSRASLEAKAKAGERSEAAGRKPGQSWHLIRWQRLEREGGLDREWAANSHRDGHLDVYGTPQPVVFDPTLRDLVASYLERPLWRRLLQR